MPLLTCRDLSLGYDGKTVVTGLNFTVNSKDYLCIVGENGSGKTTLMKALLRLQTPLAGTVTTGDGINRRQIGYLPQQTAVQKDFPASVYEVVLSGCLNRCGIRPFYSRKDKERVRQNMDKLEITPLAKRCYRELSGGQQQRVLLARALCAAEKILLLDEPVAGLDMHVTAEMYDIIEKLNRVDGMTIIMISHDIPAAVKYASHILHIGSPVFYGTTREYLESPYKSIFFTKKDGECE